MTRKLTNREIVGEAMYSVLRSLNDNIPPPPTNPDGTFKTVEQLGNERRERDYNARQAIRYRESPPEPNELTQGKEIGYYEKKIGIENVLAFLVALIVVVVVIFILFNPQI